MCNVSPDTIEYWRKKFNIAKSNKGKKVNRKQYFNEDYFETIDTDHKAYWLGFIMADGCICKANKNGNYNNLIINLKKDDIEVLNNFQKDLGSNYKITTKKSINKKLGIETEISRLKISSVKLVSDLINNSIYPNKTGKEILPSTIPDEYIKDFIRGYFDGDGSLTINKSFRICSASLEILNSINDYFYKTLKFKLNIYEEKQYKVPFFVMDSNNRKENKKILDLLYKDSTIYLNRKYLRYLDLYCSPIQ